MTPLKEASLLNRTTDLQITLLNDEDFLKKGKDEIEEVAVFCLEGDENLERETFVHSMTRESFHYKEFLSSPPSSSFFGHKRRMSTIANHPPFLLLERTKKPWAFDFSIFSLPFHSAKPLSQLPSFYPPFFLTPLSWSTAKYINEFDQWTTPR